MLTWNMEVKMLDYAVNEEQRRKILEQAQVIAVVGTSDDPYYASNEIYHYLKNAGYTVYPVNPTIPDVDGDPTYPRLQDVPEPIDIVNVFRAPEHLPDVVDDAIAARAKVLWTQLEVVSIDEAPERRAALAGMKVISSRCIRTEHQRLEIPPK